MKIEPNLEVYFSEWSWCRGCKHCWKYTNQEPCKECLSTPVGPSGPIHYEKEDLNG